MNALFRHRLLRVLPYFVSPAGDAELTLGEDGALRDGHGRVFPVVEEVPILVPDLDRVLADHYRLSRATNSGHPGFARTSRAVLRSARSKPLRAFLFGLPLDLFSLEPLEGGWGAVPETCRTPGTVLEAADGGALVVTADGALAITALRLSTGYATLEDWVAVRDVIPLEPPYLLTQEPYPDLTFSNYFEMVLYMTRQDVRSIVAAGRGRSEVAPSDTGQAPPAAAPPPQPPEALPGETWELCSLGRDNLPFFRELVRAYDLDIAGKAVLDVGCGDGWLVKVFENLGARYPLGTDIRFSGLKSYCFAEGRSRALLAMANMFEWSYAKDAFSLITLRNNSAFAKAKGFDDRFVGFGRRMLGSLAENGLVYLSFLTNGTGRLESGFTNPTLARTAAYIRAIRAGWVKTMKLGIYACFLLCRQEDLPALRARERRRTYAKRRQALLEYVQPGGPGDPRVQRNFLLAVADYASEIAQAVVTGGKSGYLLWGGGVLSRYAWMYCNMFFPEIPCGGLVLTRRQWDTAPLWIRALRPFQRMACSARLLTPGEAEREFGEDWLSVRADDRACGDGRRCESDDEMVFFPATGGDADLLDDEGPGEGGWEYHFASGDHDRSLDLSVARAYARERMRALRRGIKGWYRATLGGASALGPCARLG